MKGMKIVVLLVTTTLLLGSMADYTRAADTKQKGKAEVPRKVNMDSNLKKKLNIFFSNFSEAGVEPFARNKIDNKALIRFGVLHNYINRLDRFEPAGNDVQLKAMYVEKAVERYFGRNLEKHESVPSLEYEGGGISLSIRYKNGYYYTIGGDGEAQTFSQVVELFDIGNNEFVAIVDIYRASNAWEGDHHGTPEQWQREDPYDVPERIGRMTATIRKIYSDKKERYVLVEYFSQKGKEVKSLSAELKKPSQQTKEVVPPFANSINIGGISIGITEFTREKNIALVGFVFRCINETWFPRRFSILITDDRGNEYKANVDHYPFLPMPLVGSTWITDPPVIVRIPKIAPISKFELIPDTTGIPDKLRGRIPNKFNLDYQKLTPLPPLSLKFKINPEQILTGKEIKQDKNISIWLGEPKIGETIKEKSTKKTISVSVPVTIENRDYNPHEASMQFEYEIQLNSGRSMSPDKRLALGRTVKGASKETLEHSFKVEVEKNEHVQLISVYRVPVVPFPGVFAVTGDLSPKLLGFLYISEKDITPFEIALPALPPRKPVPPHIEDGDWFPDGSKIVLSELVIEKVGWREERKRGRIFIMNPDGTDKKVISFKEQEYMDHVAPLVSPDGQKIAFVVDRDDQYASIYVMDVGGDNVRGIGDFLEWGFFDCVAYAWISNDKIVFWKDGRVCRTAPDSDIFYMEGKIYIVDIKSGDIQKLKTPPPELLRGKFVSNSVIKDFQK